jgi:ubiquitin carboxyl-terminal hydrolase 40
MFFGLMDSVITCSVCEQSRVKTDRFLDLGLQVRGCKGVEESLD